MPARAPASILMLQTVMRPSIDNARIAEPAYSMTWPVAPSVPMCPMMARMMSLAVTPVGQLSLDGDAEGLGLGLRQRLRGENVLNFAGADAESQGSKRAVGAGVRIAADNGHAGLGDAELGADNMNDALLAGVHVVEFDAEVGAILAQRFICLAAIWSTMFSRSSIVVGTLWSTVAMLRSGRRTLRPARRRPSNACGEVTS